ncbi:MAG: PhnD/SsuA/transferrin family substrate-binding protein [Acidiferrobacterales bacterium]
MTSHNTRYLLNDCLRLALGLALTLAAVALPHRVFASGPAHAGILFGSVAMDIPAVMDQRLSPLTRYLAHSLGRPVSLRLSPTMSNAINEISSGDVDIAYLTPVAYVAARERAHVKLIARLVTDHRSAFKLVIVVRQDSPIRKVSDLRGKRFAFGDPAAILQRAVVVGAGIRLSDFGAYRFLNHYDNIVRGILVGDFDAGILTDAIAAKAVKEGLRVIYSSPALPPYNITASSKMSDRMVRRLKTALLALDDRKPADRAVIRALDPAYDGFAPGSDRDYNVIRRLIAPFEKPAQLP